MRNGGLGETGMEGSIVVATGLSPKRKVKGNFIHMVIERIELSARRAPLTTIGHGGSVRSPPFGRPHLPAFCGPWPAGDDAHDDDDGLVIGHTPSSAAPL